ncbi:MAG TPA: filamentous hemagglutinin N-terminal domain-containing protein, partial [Spirochaetota bacterium]
MIKRKHVQTIVSLMKKVFVYFVVYEIVLSAVPVRAADIAVDATAPAANKPTIDVAQNGVPVVNLAAPTAGGVSHNKFENYNVGPNGVILNNSKDIGVTVLGGALYGNPNYQGGATPARIVVNEVTGTKGTSLRGYTEMFGKSAELVLVNPNGIMCNGAGFINIPRVTLGTGTPVMENGFFKGINVQGGTVSVEGMGLDVRNVDYCSIISRVAAINGGIWGKDVNVTTGTGYYDYENKTFDQKDGAGAKPEIGIDASALGSLYAGRITLVSNEKGVGVRSNGDMIADAGDIRITADGNIELKNVQSAQNLAILSNVGVITQNGSSTAAGTSTYDAKNITNRGLIKAGKTLSITGKTVNDGGTIDSSEDIKLDTNGSLSNRGGIIRAGNDLSVTGEVDNGNGTIESSGNITLATGGALSNADGKIVALKDLSIQGKINNTNGTIGSSGNMDIVTDGPLVNSGGKIMLSGESGTLSIKENGGLTLDGDIRSEGKIDLTATGDMTFTSPLSAGKDIMVHAQNVVNNTSLSAGGDIRINANGNVYENGSAITARNALTITSPGTIFNNGTLGGKEYHLTAADIENGTAGKIAGGDGNSNITAGVITNSGTIGSSSNLNVNTGTITNTNTLANIAAGNNLSLDATTIINAGGLIYSGKDMIVTAHLIDNEQGWLYSCGNMTLNEKGAASVIHNYAGNIEAEGNVTVNLGSSGT